MKLLRHFILIIVVVHLNYSCTPKEVDKDKALMEFVSKVSDAYSSKDIQKLKDLYITESEFIEMFEYYSLSSDYGKREYDQNVTIIEQDRFDNWGRKKIFNCENPIEFIDNKYPKMSKFSKILDSSREIDTEDEYYLMHGLFKIKCSYISKFNNELTDTKLTMNLGELIFIPHEGWRLCDTPR